MCGELMRTTRSRVLGWLKCSLPSCKCGISLFPSTGTRSAPELHRNLGHIPESQLGRARRQKRNHQWWEDCNIKSINSYPRFPFSFGLSPPGSQQFWNFYFFSILHRICLASVLSHTRLVSIHSLFLFPITPWSHISVLHYKTLGPSGS